MLASVDALQHDDVDALEQRGNRVDDFNAFLPNIINVFWYLAEAARNVFAAAGKRGDDPHALKHGISALLVDRARKGRHVRGVAADDADS